MKTKEEVETKMKRNEKNENEREREEKKTNYDTQLMHNKIHPRKKMKPIQRSRSF